jgi:hypothetical protein
MYIAICNLSQELDPAHFQELAATNTIAQNG